MNLSQHIENFISDFANPDRAIIIALSGGVDSVVLLDLLVNSSINLQRHKCVYVDHGLSDQAKEWGQFCRQLCNNYGVTFFLESVELCDSERNIEANARQVRYQALNRHVSEGSILVTAQHSDDQCETLLLALKRGAGPLGLSAMPSQLSFGKGSHNRPLLDVSRADIVSYAHNNQLQWVEDGSNQDNRFDRNFLRNEILPRLNNILIENHINFKETDNIMCNKFHQ